MVPASAARTGTADLPRPGWRARRTPSVTVTGASAPDSHLASRGWRGSGAAVSEAAGVALASRQAGQVTQATRSPTMAAGTAVSTSQSVLIPGDGSASRAAPTGISGDAATATAAARTAPAAVATATSSSPAAVSWRRVIPRAASTRNPELASSSSRPATCVTISSAVHASTSAKMARATTSGWIDRSTAAYSAPWSDGMTCPWVPGNRRASACASPPTAAALAPGRSSSSAPSKAR